MIDNPIVEEVHRIRQEILAEYNGDLKALIQDLRDQTDAAARTGQAVVAVPAALGVAPAEPKRIAG